LIGVVMGTKVEHSLRSFAVLFDFTRVFLVFTLTAVVGTMYGRWWEMRRLIGVVMGKTQDTTIMITSYIQGDDSEELMGEGQVRDVYAADASAGREGIRRLMSQPGMSMRATGEEDWAFLKPKEIDDPEDKKPGDWVDDAQMDDPEDSKPADWGNEPETIPDPEAEQPEDWDEEDDGAWEAPQIPNPKFQGEWKAKRIPNPAYKGVWSPKRIPNPDYVEDKELHVSASDIAAVGIDVWQVKSGTIFDNIIISDSLEEVNAFVADTWGKTKDAEKQAFDKAAEAKKAAEAEEKKEEDAKEDEEE